PLRSPAGLTAVVFAPQENPALIRWAYAKSQNVYPTFRPTPTTSFLGAVYGLGPLLFWIFVLKADRDHKEKCIQEGKHKRSPFSVFF
ncbi:NDUB4 dehydrogenase, partial [Motacilla alba]|nr:NDUB4 dehydrogenase [Motacilla alba]